MVNISFYLLLNLSLYFLPPYPISHTFLFFSISLPHIYCQIKSVLLTSAYGLTYTLNWEKHILKSDNNTLTVKYSHWLFLLHYSYLNSFNFIIFKTSLCITSVSHFMHGITLNSTFFPFQIFLT